MQNILQEIGIENYIFLSALLFSIGVFGVLYRRNAIIMFMSIEIMLNAVNLLFVAFSTYHQDAQGLHTVRSNLDLHAAYAGQITDRRLDRVLRRTACFRSSRLPRVCVGVES